MSSAQSIVLTATDIGVRFGHIAALDGCSLTLPEHGMISLIGENGSGKSTLLDVLSGFVPITAGRLTKESGVRIVPGELRRAAARLHQRVVLPADLRVGEYLSICARPRAASGLRTPSSFFHDPAERVSSVQADLLSAAGVADRERLIGQLSWGQQRIVAICGILRAPKRMLLLDEPFAGIVTSLCDSLADILAAEGSRRLVLFADHELLYAARADRVIVLKSGRVAADFRRSELAGASLMRYFGS